MNLYGFIKGILIRDQTDKTKTLSLEVDPASTTNTQTTIKSAQTANRAINLPDANDTLMGKATVDVMTNKSYDADGTGNVLTNVDNGNIKALAAIDATKLADGTVSNTEYQYINSLTSNAQDQLSARVVGPVSSTDNALVRFDSTTGKLTQDSLGILDDLGALSGLTQLNVDNVQLNGNTISATSGDLILDGADIDANSNIIKNVTNPVSAQDAATKAYVDSFLQGISWKQPAVVATTADITLSGEQTIDGVLTSSSRVLVKSQTDQTENGVYISDAGAWSRSSDMNSSSEFDSAAVLVSQGTINSDSGFVQTTDSVSLGVSNIVFAQFTGISAGANSSLSNLTATSINQNLLPSADNLRELGSASFRYSASYILSSAVNQTTLYNGAFTGGNLRGVLSGADFIMPSGTTVGVSLRNSINGSHVGINSLDNAVANATATDNVLIETGNKTAGTGDSGQITLQTGTSSGGVRGKILLSGLSVDVNSSKIINVTDPTSAQDAATKAYADALNPMTTGGDLIYGGASGVQTRLANGLNGQVLKSQGTTLAPIWATTSGTGLSSQSFTVSGSLVVPTGVTIMAFTGVGGGGGGGGSGGIAAAAGAGGGGGGSGSEVITTNVVVVPGDTLTITIGTGGTGGTAGATGSAGGIGGNGTATTITGTDVNLYFHGGFGGGGGGSSGTSGLAGNDSYFGTGGASGGASGGGGGGGGGLGNGGDGAPSGTAASGGDGLNQSGGGGDGGGSTGTAGGVGGRSSSFGSQAAGGLTTSSGVRGGGGGGGGSSLAIGGAGGDGGTSPVAGTAGTLGSGGGGAGGKGSGAGTGAGAVGGAGGNGKVIVFWAT